MMEQRIGQGLDRECRPFPGAHVDAHRLPGKQINDSRHVHLLAMLDHLREVGHPNVVRVRRSDREKKVGICPCCLGFSVSFAFPPVGPHSEQSHDPLRPLAVRAEAVVFGCLRDRNAFLLHAAEDVRFHFFGHPMPCFVAHDTMVIVFRPLCLIYGVRVTRTGRHQFLFRRLLKCRRCGYSAIAEEHKNHVYYRCQSATCAPTCIREEAVEQEMLRALGPLRFTDEERAYLKAKVAHLKETWRTDREVHVNALRLSLGSLHDRLNRLTDAFIDGTIEKDLFERRKTGLLLEQKQAEESLRELQANGHLIPDRLSEFLELAGSAYFQYKLALPEEKRDLLQIVTSNRWVQQKNVEVTLAPAFREVANRLENSNGSPKGNRTPVWRMRTACPGH